MFATIRARMFALTAALVAIALGVNIGLNYFIANSHNEDSIKATLRAVGDSHAAGIDDWVATHTQMISSLQDAVLSPDPIVALKQVAAAGGFKTAYVGYADKTAKFSDPTGIPPDYDPTQRPWYKQAVAAGKAVVTPPYVDAGSGNLVVTFAVPVIREGVVKAVISGDMTMESVIANVHSIHPTPASFGMLVDSKGQIVAYPDMKFTLKPISDVAPSLTGNRLATLLTSEAPLSVNQRDSSVKLMRAKSVAGTDWHVIVALDHAEATAGMHSLLAASLTELVVIAATAAVIMAVVTTLLLRRLASVRDAMDAISAGEGDLTQRLPADGSDEVAQIAGSFNVFMDKLRDVMRHIRNASESVRTASNEITTGNQTCQDAPNRRRQACRRRPPRWMS